MSNPVTDFASDRPVMRSRAAAVGEIRRAFAIPEFCHRYGIGRSKTYEEIRAGRLIAVKSGQRTLIREEDAEAWLRSLPSARCPKRLSPWRTVHR